MDYHIYINCGITTSRGNLILDGRPIDYTSKAIGSATTATSGTNEPLLEGLREIYDVLLDRNKLYDRDIKDVWISGMASSPFGIIRIPHMSLPLTAQKMYDESVKYFEESYFDRELRLLRGANNVPPGETPNLENVEYISSIRGEDIDIIGFLASNQSPDCPFVIVAPSSHTQFCYVKDGALRDILSLFTGELRYGLMKNTILSGEQDPGDVEMDEQFVRLGRDYRRKYGICRALQIVHSTNNFNILTKPERSQVLTGIITSSAVDSFIKKIQSDWTDVEEIVIFGGKPYIESYRILIRDELPDMKLRLLKNLNGVSFAVCGFLDILKIAKEAESQQD